MVNEAAIRREICEIGRRVYARGFAAGNDGNISFRLNAREVVCTPTLICKGFMRPEDLCVVNLDGDHVAGHTRRTSEIKLHLEIYRQDPHVKAVVHCHPPHATAFAVAQEPIPSGVLPEIELFLGVVPRAPYETPGGADFAATIRPFVGGSNTVVLTNHGTVSWGPSVERAYWQTEMLDQYCRVLILSRQIGRVNRLPADKVRELLALRKNFGAPEDPRASGEGELFVNPEFGA